ncbi:MAG: DEAD/DEAH box helicase [Candidatus Babeliaceae bacterium]|nr:DEAD/DEAH box helicase [Candidatus Babeliaceae bacterium]
MISFKDLNLSIETQQTLEKLGFTQPTEIQAKAIPLLLSKPMDFHGQAQTGTGKTLAFGLPLLERIDKTNRFAQALVVAPTRELALQICDSLKPFAQAAQISITTIYGGSSMEEQIRNLRRGVQVVIGTPGRLNDHLRRKTLDIGTIKTLVLDEADIMLDMGFKDEVEEILRHAPKNREIWLFSATVKSGISDLMAAYMHDTQSVKVAKKTADAATTQQFYCVVPMRQRLPALQRFIESATDFYGFVFCQTKILTSEIAEQLIRAGYNVGALHGDLSQAQRNLVIKRFKSKEISIVIATDVAARGIDIANLTYVINYSLPEDLESYVHRIGRTGRAGKTGTAISFINRSEARTISILQKRFNFTISPIDVPSKEQIVSSRLKFAQEYLAQVSESHIQHHEELKSLVTQLSAEELRDIIEKMIYDKFIKSIDQEENINFTSTPKDVSSESGHHGTASGLQEFCLAVGVDDGVTQDDVVEYLTATKLITADQIAKIRVIKRKTFVEVPSATAQPLVNALSNTSLAGRKTRITIVEPQDSLGGGGRNRERTGGRDGGYRGNRGGFGGGRGGDRGGYRGRR